MGATFAGGTYARGATLFSPRANRVGGDFAGGDFVGGDPLSGGEMTSIHLTTLHEQRGGAS